MKKRIYYLLILLFSSAFAFISCEKEITMDLPEEEPKIVIEGYIENGLPARVSITKSAPYFDPIDSLTLINSIVSDALVIVSDGVTYDTLQKDTILALPPIIYVGNNIIGEIGKTYYLTVVVGGQAYTSQTTIQQPIAFDSLWFKLSPDNDTVGDIFALGTDNGAAYNYYRVFTKNTNIDYGFVPIFESVWDDKFFNGMTFTIQLYHGISSNITELFEDDGGRGVGYKVGDKVITKLCTMDYESFKFWSAAESEIVFGSNPFMTTTSVPTNIQGGAIGCWTGYCATYDSIICTP
ncbi:MAG TPA: DUF4249 domain-containing protein [Bacteroidales bacterium]|mgnify:CR=1 FL=1|nr:DUF4249 domain-containing protein [Bacteroidales bacterium]